MLLGFERHDAGSIQRYLGSPESVWDRIALLTKRLWFKTHRRQNHKLLITQKGGSREVWVRVEMVARYATPRITTAGVERGLKTELVQIGPSVNEAEGRDAEIVLRRFGRDRWWWTEVLSENVGGVVGEDRLRGAYLHRLATAPSFYTFILLWLITARPRADTVPNMPNDLTTE
jgi:hypothetical protein